MFGTEVAFLEGCCKKIGSDARKQHQDEMAADRNGWRGGLGKCHLFNQQKNQNGLKLRGKILCKKPL